MTVYKLRKLTHNHFTTRLAFQHLIGDPGITLDKRTDPETGIHKLLKAVDNHPMFNKHRPDLDSPVTIVWRQARRLEIQHHHTIRQSSLHSITTNFHYYTSKELTVNCIPFKIFYKSYWSYTSYRAYRAYSALIFNYSITFLLYLFQDEDLELRR